MGAKEEVIAAHQVIDLVQRTKGEVVIDLYPAVTGAVLQAQINRRDFFRDRVDAGIDPSTIGIEKFRANRIKGGFAGENGEVAWLAGLGLWW